MTSFAEPYVDDLHDLPGHGRGELLPDESGQLVIASVQEGEFVHEFHILMTLKPVPNNVIAEIIDDIFLPLVCPKPARTEKN